MAKSLLISVRFYEGRYHGEEDRFHNADGWPPSPGRLFQALVAGAACGERLSPEDQRALHWLESLKPPRIAAPPARRGKAVKLYVPNNDLDAKDGDPARVSEIRDEKIWRPCLFDADEAVVYVWDFDSGSTDAAQICVIAGRLYQLGRGIDPAWATAEVLDRERATVVLDGHSGVLREPRGAGEVATPHNGTLESLIERYRRMPFSTVPNSRKNTQLFAHKPKSSFHYVGYDTAPQRLHFELRGEDGGFAPRPLHSAAAVVTGLRNAAANRLQEALRLGSHETTRIEKLIVGRDAGPADLAQRIRIIPIPSVGHEQVDPAIRRIMVEVPVECPIRVDDLRWAFSGLEPCDPETGEIWGGRLISTEDSQMAQRFMQRACLFRSLTAVALPNAHRRRIDSKGRKQANERLEEEAHVAGAVVQSLRHAGVRVRPLDIKVQREPFQRRGAPADSFAASSRFSEHALWHVEFRFPEAVTGPLVIGDGRFCGLGLMVPVRNISRDSAFVFSIPADARIAIRDTVPLLHAVRRALMALSRDDKGQVPKLFSGHEREGGPSRADTHDHVFLTTDDANENGYIDRLIIAAPWICDRNTKGTYDDRVCFDRVLKMLTHVRAGKLGVLRLEPLGILEPGDLLVGPSYLWKSRTPYRPTRHAARGKDPEAAVLRDIITECERRGLPKPKVELLELNVGPRGGGLAADILLRFAVALEGPILLGRDSHAGGGLFHAVLDGAS